MNIIIREAAIADAEVIADLSRQTFYETFALENRKEDMDKFMNEQFTKAALMEEVGSAGNIFLLAFADGILAGYAKLRTDFTREAKSSVEIARLYASSNMIGKGVGRALMESCIEKARELQRQTIWLGVWEKNERAIRFYKQFGFEKSGEQDFLLGDDIQHDWLMKKQLP